MTSLAGVDRLSLSSYSASSPRSPSRYSNRWIALFLLTDVAMFLAAAYLAGALVDRQWGLEAAEHRFLHSSIVFVCIWLIIFAGLGLYRQSFAFTFKDEFYFSAAALILGVVPQFILFSIMPQLSASRVVLLSATIFGIILVGIARAALRGVHLRVDKADKGKILVVGDAGAVEELSRVLESESLIDGSAIIAESVDASERRNPSGQYVQRAKQLGCDRLVIAAPPIEQDLYRLLRLTRRNNIQLYWPSEASTDQMSQHKERWRIAAFPEICTARAKFMKRAIDVLSSLCGIIILSPIIALVAIVVLLDSGSPVLFRQPRVGRYGKVFQILKFRTMRTDADQRWAKPGDSRITRVGAILRRTSLDELPQLFNVLLGHMSIVGPRPEMVSFEEEFARSIPHYVERRLALPGITGWAQINLHRNLTPEDAPEVLRYDLFYVEHWSLFLDFGIVFKTAAEFLFHRAV